MKSLLRQTGCDLFRELIEKLQRLGIVAIDTEGWKLGAAALFQQRGYCFKLHQIQLSTSCCLSDFLQSVSLSKAMPNSRDPLRASGAQFEGGLDWATFVHRLRK